MNLEDIKNYLSENKDSEDVQELLKGFNSTETTADDVKAFLQTDEGKKLLQPKLDSYFNKGLETWQNNNLDKLVNEEISKRNPDKTPEQIELERIKKQLADMESAKTRETLKNKALTVATDKQIPTNLIDYLLGQDEETTLSNLDTFEESMKSYVDSQVKARISDSSYTPPADGGNGKSFTKEQVVAMSHEEINEHWDEVKDLI